MVSYLNLISLVGIPVMLVLAWLMSSHRSKVNLRLVVLGIVLQFALAAILFQSQNWTFNGAFENGILFAAVDGFFNSLIGFVEAGTGFVFRSHGVDPDHTNPAVLMSTFAFGVLPTVVFFAALMSILYHIGLMQIVIRAMAWVMQKTLGTTGPESLAAAANVLVGHTEAPLVVKPYVSGMTRSELNALMVGGFSTITGSLMAIFVAEGISAGHLLSASIISAPAALVIAKILQPETEEVADAKELVAKMEQPATNVIEAAAIGASDGMKLAINIAAMLIAFLALIAMVDAMLGGTGNLIQWLILKASGSVVEIDWSLDGLFGAVFFPLAWIMGIEAADCSIAGQLLGKKMVVNEFVAYLGLAEVTASGAAADAATISERSKVILTYALCGFSNFGAIGIQIGGIGPLAPERRSDLAQLGLRAMLGGMLACCMTACMAGLLYGVLK
jgi:CNT family concentrative nucleoside transporter